MYPQASHPASGMSGFGFRRSGGDWREGYSMWTQDYPRADRHFSEAMRRLTRIHVRSVEQPVNLDDGDDVYNWPWLYAVQVGPMAAHRLAGETDAREYLLRGGFFMCDDFWGEYQWTNFMESMHRVFPDRAVVDIPNDDQIFHSVYDLNDRYQVPGARYRSNRRHRKKCSGLPAALARHL